MIPTDAGIIPDRADTTPKTDIKRVGVFVDEMPQNIITRAVNFELDLIQLHGHETPTMIRNLRRTLDPDIRPGIQFIKAISVSCRDDIAAYKPYEDCVDYFLFDTKCSTVGGSGAQFDWSMLEAYDGHKPFLLSGGIGPDDAERVKAFHHPQCIGIDLNSRFETAPGVKDVDLLRTFIQHIKP
jgi:phosphoribosylanthranilate isomerase